MLEVIKKQIPLDNPLRLLYHKVRAIVANFVYQFPSRGMIIIGVTWTNGKTTTSNIIWKWLVEAWERVFMFTTVNYIIDGKEYKNETKMTSPDAFYLQKLFAEAKKAGCTHAVIETASHGITMNRIWGLDYDIAVLTNITQDHLDLHGTMENYVNTKLKLFKNLIRSKRKKWIKKTAIINIDSEFNQLFRDETYDSLINYWVFSTNANLRARDIQNTDEWTRFSISIPGQNLDIKTRLLGDFNVYNITAAVGVFISLGIRSEKIQEIVQNIGWVPGRMDEVQNTLGFKIYVDYAHTADALEKVLTVLWDHKWEGRLITLFWATWDRDKSKRPIMWKVVSDNSDIVFLTQDDDYSENTESIIKDVSLWIERIEWKDYWIIADRWEAIRTAILTAKKWDIVLVAGKWDEHVLVTNNGSIDWHDKTFIQSVLKDIEDNSIV